MITTKQPPTKTEIVTADLTITRRCADCGRERVFVYSHVDSDTKRTYYVCHVCGKVVSK